MDKATLEMARTAMKDRNNKAQDIAKRLGITTTTLYDYVNGDGSLKEKGAKLIQGFL